MLKPQGTKSSALRCLGASLALIGPAALAQSADSPRAGLASDPSPYYIGGSQTFTHDSNAFGVPFGPSDNYSSTSLLAGFDQPFSRQRLSATARVSLNRYQDLNELDNTSYSLGTRLDWETVMRLSGNLSASLDQGLSAPAGSASPVSTRNLQRRQGVSGVARWGGDSLITLESRLGYSKVDYSADEYASGESENEVGSIGVYYQPGTRLRAGLAARFDRTRTPKAVQLSNGSFESNAVRGRNVDLLADYNNGSNLTASARVSYTRQTNSNVDSADFSGFTGSLSFGYRATGKINLNIGAARDAGFNTTARTFFVPVAATPSSPISFESTSVLYQTNQVTNSFFAGANYAATAKIGLSARARYSRARLVSSATVASAGQANPDVVDEIRGVGLGATFAYSRLWSFNCELARDRRKVSGASPYAYTDDLAACSAQLTWR